MSKEKIYKKNPKGTNGKLIIHLKFKSLLRLKSKKLLENINNYDNSLECKICHKPIQDSSNWHYLYLYAEDNEKFITFHFRCAFKRNTGEKFGDIAGEFDYIYYNNHKK